MNYELGYADLNIPRGPESTLKKRVVRALDLGYRSVAVNTSIHQESMNVRNEKKKGAKNFLDLVPEPETLDLKETDYLELSSKGLKPTILQRLTIVIENNDFLIYFNKSENAKKYDIIAISVTSAQTLQALLKSAFKFDILAYDPNLTTEIFFWNRKLYRELLNMHVSFELLYGDMILDREFRQKIIHTGYDYHTSGRSKGIILSSGAKNVMQLRAPADVANLCTILSMTEAQGKAAVLQQCTHVYKTALGRRFGVFRVRVEKVEEVEKVKEKVFEEYSISSDDASDLEVMEL